jgi:hypothetical protein
VVVRGGFAAVLLVIVGSAGARLLRIDLTSYVDAFAGGGVQQGDNSLRLNQIEVLVREGLRLPVFGHGVGATIPGYVRDPARPWNFELQYFLYFFQLGVVGLAALLTAAALALRAIRTSITVATEPLLTVQIAALACALAILAANASNPYLQAVGHQWMLFLPAGVIGAQFRADATR